jgi:hypothetical protein
MESQEQCILEKLIVRPTQVVRKFQMVLHRVHKSPPLDPVHSQLNPVHTFKNYFCIMYFNITFSFNSKSVKLSSIEISRPKCLMYY